MWQFQLVEFADDMVKGELTMLVDRGEDFGFLIYRTYFS